MKLRELRALLLHTRTPALDECEVEVALTPDGKRLKVSGVTVDDNCGGEKPIVVIEVGP